LIHQIVKRNFPFPPPAQLQNYIYGGVTNDNLAKGVKGVLDMHFVGFIFGHGNSPSLNNSAGRQHSLLSPLDCLPAKAGGAVNGGAYAPFILTVDWLGRLYHLLYFLVQNQIAKYIYVATAGCNPSNLPLIIRRDYFN